LVSCGATLDVVGPASRIDDAALGLAAERVGDAAARAGLAIRAASVGEVRIAGDADRGVCAANAPLIGRTFVMLLPLTRRAWLAAKFERPAPGKPPRLASRLHACPLPLCVRRSPNALWL
jgi:hypothetical protein